MQILPPSSHPKLLIYGTMVYTSLVPRPHPAFRHLQYVHVWGEPGNKARYILDMEYGKQILSWSM